MLNVCCWGKAFNFFLYGRKVQTEQAAGFIDHSFVFDLTLVMAAASANTSKK